MDSAAIPIRTSSLLDAETPATYKASRTERRRLKRSLDSLNSHFEPEQWRGVNESMLINEQEFLDFRYEVQSQEYSKGLVSEEEWKTFQREHGRNQARVRHDLSNAGAQRRKLAVQLQQNLTSDETEAPGLVRKASGDLLLEPYEARVSRSSKDQSAFRADMVQEYNCREPGGDGLWCSIIGKYLDPDYVTAAHIFPYVLGPRVMSMIFGEESPNEMFAPCNGLIMGAGIEPKFDKHLIVLVPGSDVPREGIIRRWRTRLVDKTQKDRSIPEAGCKLGDLDGRELEFKSDARPAARYLYYHYVIALLRARRHKRKGWLTNIAGKEIMWATPGKYLRESMLKTLARHAGHDVYEESVVFDEHVIRETTPLTDEQVKDQTEIAGKIVEYDDMERSR